jgi:hypothetical protein
LSGNTYFKDSDFAATSEGEKFEDLFGDNWNANANVYPYITPITNTAGTLTGLAVPIVFSGTGKPDVAYTVERATVDAAGNAGDYDKVSVYKDVSSTGTTGDLTADILGNLPYSLVYDKILPATGGKYKYRIKATKGTLTQTKEISYGLGVDVVTVDPLNYVDVMTIEIVLVDAEGTDKKYNITPKLTYKGVLQANDKLVIYYVKGSDTDIYKNGPYKKAQSISFSKTELEAATGKDLSIPKAEGDEYAYVQAYFEFADGRERKNVTVSSSGDGIAFINSYNGGGSQIYYAKLKYDDVGGGEGGGGEG